MSVHDAYARLTPYELSFPNLDVARGHFSAIRNEAEVRGVDAVDPAVFLLLTATSRALREIRGAQDDLGLVHQYGLLIYHAFHFFEAGERLYFLRSIVLRRLLEDESASGNWSLVLEPAAGYVQLPQHLVWARPGAGSPPESLDGFFWARSGADRFAVLLALGLRTDRPGLSVVPLSDLPVAEAQDWTRMRMREDDIDFSSTLPGSEIEGLYELCSCGEALKLVARVLRRLETVTGTELVNTRAAPDDGPRASALAYHVIDRCPKHPGDGGRSGRDHGRS